MSDDKPLWAGVEDLVTRVSIDPTFMLSGLLLDGPSLLIFVTGTRLTGLVARESS